VTNASAVAWWGNSDKPLGPYKVYGASRPDGVIYLGSIPPGWVTFQVNAPGYAMCEGAAEITGGYDVQLKKGGRISGHCLHEGSPVENFEVIYWSEGNSRTYRTKTFLNRKDGSFELDNLMSCDWTCYAAGPVLPSGKPTTAHVNVDQETKVE